MKTMTTTMKTTLSAFGSGLLFGVGLLVSGMTDPHRVRAFLDFAGHWNPSLAGVMAGAIAVHGTALWLERRRSGVPLGPQRPIAVPLGPQRPIAVPLGPQRPIAVPLGPQRPIDGRLIGGAAVFGVGWGLAGYCPGPAIVSLGFAVGPVWAFFAAMVVGVLVGDAFGARASRDTHPTADQAPAC